MSFPFLFNKTDMLAEYARNQEERKELVKQLKRLDDRDNEITQRMASMEKEITTLRTELKRKRRVEEEEEEAEGEDFIGVETKECKGCLKNHPLALFQSKRNKKNKEGVVVLHTVNNTVCHPCRKKKSSEYKKAKRVNPV